MSVAGLILAAGSSRRLGRPKQTVRLGGELLLERAVRVAQEAELNPLFVVLRAQAAYDVDLESRGCIVLCNQQADEGMAASVRCGVRAALLQDHVEGAVVMTCDQWATRAEHLRMLYARPDCVTGSAYAGKIGVPAYFPRTTFTELLTLKGDVGARDLLRDARVVHAEELRLDLDTDEDLLRAEQALLLASQPGAAPRVPTVE